jgi:hypothetical protein
VLFVLVTDIASDVARELTHRLAVN